MLLVRGCGGEGLMSTERCDCCTRCGPEIPCGPAIETAGADCAGLCHCGLDDEPLVKDLAPEELNCSQD